MHSQYGGSSISVIDKALSRGPNFPLECLPLIYAVMQATHFLLILWGFLTLFTVGLPSFQPKAAFNILFLVPFVFQHVFTLGRQIKCWIHFFISFYLLICAKHASLCKVTCAVVACHAHFVWQRATRDAIEQLWLEWWVVPARQTELPVLQRVCTSECVSVR